MILITPFLAILMGLFFTFVVFIDMIKDKVSPKIRFKLEAIDDYLQYGMFLLFILAWVIVICYSLSVLGQLEVK